MDNGLIFSLRRRGSVFRFVPPFATTEDQMDLAADILDHAFRQVTSNQQMRPEQGPHSRFRTTLLILLKVPPASTNFLS